MGDFFWKSKLFFFINVNLHFSELVYSKKYFNLVKILVLKLFKIAANQTVFGDPKVPTLWNLQKNVRCICKKHDLIKTFFTNGLNMGLPLRAWVGKTAHEAKTHWLSSKEKVPGTAVSKKAMRKFSETSLLFFCKQCIQLPTS